MKNIIRKRSLILLVAFVAGCQSWLDVSPKSEIKAENLFQSQEGFWDALTGIYIGMTDQSIYGANLSWGAIEFMAWQHANTNNSGSWFELQRYDFESTRANSFATSVWSKLYNVVAEINYLLYALDEYGHILTPDIFNAIKGEALALRAYCHFDLIRLFAEGNLANNQAALEKPCIPYVTEHSKEVTAQKSYRETIAMLVRDVDEAITLLDVDHLPRSTYFTMNHLGARLLKTRIAQWTNDPNTLTYALELIDILESISSKWVIDNMAANRHLDQTLVAVFPTELLFCLDVFRLRTYMNSAYSTHVNSNINRNMLINSTDFVNNNLFELNNPPRGVSSSDLRYLNWYSYFSEPLNDISGWISIKARQPATDYRNIIALMRVSEPYLIAAESYIGVNSEKTVDLINFLRTKRNNSVDFLVPQGLSDLELQNIIQLEYRREFTQEGQLFFYYKRKGVVEIPGADLTVGEMTNARYTLRYPVVEQDFGRSNNNDD